jgi:hypothetical protein
VGGWEKFQRQKQTNKQKKNKPGGGRGENKVPKKKKLRSGRRNGKQKKVNLG